MQALEARIERSARILSDAQGVVVSTGAGMSKESGIPTFRDAPSSLWANYDPMQLATREGFTADPPLVWRWYQDRQHMIAEARPHAGHIAVAEMEKLLANVTVLTQNIDNLHSVAGSRNLVEVHGNIFRYKCFDHNHPCETLPEEADPIPPRCHCGSYLRPDVVWFGEMLPEDAVARAYQALESCDVILVIGTSGMVHPAAGFPAVARRAGAAVVEINPEETPITPEADIFLKGTAGDVTSKLVERLKSIIEEKGSSA